MHLAGPVWVVPATAALRIQQLTADVGKERPARVIGVLELDQAAAAAAVAEALPFGIRHFRHGLALPERGLVSGHRSARQRNLKNRSTTSVISGAGSGRQYPRATAAPRS